MKNPVLTPEEIIKFQKQGYLLYKKPLFSPEKLHRLTSIFEEHLADKGTKLSDELDRPHDRDERLFEFLFSSEVLDLVEPIIGSNIGLFSSHFICKDPHIGRRTPWHTDMAYWEKVAERFDQIVTVWLAIDRSFIENGCLGVLPGSHLLKQNEHESVDGYLNLQVKNLDKSGAVYFELEPGECSLHDARIVHGAEANTSPYRRCGYTMRYFSTETRVTNNGFYLARGKNVSGSSLLTR